MINPKQLRDRVVIPVCHMITPTWDIVPAVELLMGTAMQESECGGAIAQFGGPALGVWQVEPATHDLVFNWAQTKPAFKAVVNGLSLAHLFAPFDRKEQMVGNLYYSCAIARLLYMSVPSPLPKSGDVEGQWMYYKINYNSVLGAATREQYMSGWQRLQGLLR